MAVYRLHSKFVDDSRIHYYKYMNHQADRNLDKAMFKGQRDGTLPTPVLKRNKDWYNRQLDIIDTAEGKMSREDFHKKWNTFSETSYVSESSSEISNINGKVSGHSEKMVSGKVPGRPRVTRITKKVLVPEQREFGIGKFLWKGVRALARPKHLLKHAGSIMLGGLIAGPLGAAVGAGFSGLNSWHEEGEEMGHSFDDWGQSEFSDRRFSKPIGNREIVSEATAELGRKSGVIQRKPNGSWGIISYKTTKPTWWPADYSSREKASGALRGYEAHKHGGK